MYDSWNSRVFSDGAVPFFAEYVAFISWSFKMDFVLKQLVFSFGHLIFQQLAHQRKMDAFTIAKRLTTSCHIASHNAFDFKMNPDF